MPAARNQEVTVRRPGASSAPSRSRGSRAPERRSSQCDRSKKALARKAGRCDKDMGRLLGFDGWFCNLIVARGPASVYPPALTRQRAGSPTRRPESWRKSRKVQLQRKFLRFLAEDTTNTYY